MTTSSDAVLCTNLTLLFSEAEDRLVLLASNPVGAKEAFFVTRRLTARLINGIASLLERSNVAASKAPGEMRSDIVLMEHQGAIADAGEAKGSDAERGGPTGKKSQTLQVSPRLLKTVNISTLPNAFQVTFQADESPPVALKLNRLDLHRVLELLKRQAEGAGWNLQIEADWLGDNQSQLTVN